MLTWVEIERCLSNFVPFTHLYKIFRDFFQSFESISQRFSLMQEGMDMVASNTTSLDSRVISLEGKEVYAPRPKSFEVNLLDFGWTGKRTLDVTSILQQAINEAQVHTTVDGGAPPIIFPPGQGSLSSTITWKSSPLIGHSIANAGTRIYWEGPDTSPAFVKDPNLSGGLSFGKMTYINFRPGQSQPASWIDFGQSGKRVDAHLELSWIHFVGGYHQIKCGGWYNLHWEHLRFDASLSYPLVFKPTAGQFLSSGHIGKFTYDPSFGFGPTRQVTAPGFVLFDLTEANANLGTFTFATGRVEGLATPWPLPSSLIVLHQPVSNTNTRLLNIALRDLTIHANFQQTGGLIHRTQESLTGSDLFLLDNVHTYQVPNILSGNWPSFIQKPAMPVQGRIYALTYNDVEVP